MISLRRQLWRNGVLSLLGLALVLWLAGRWLLQQGLYDQVGGRLAHDAEALLAGLRWTDGKAVLVRPELGDVYDQPRSGHYFAIGLEDGRVLRSRSMWDENLPLPVMSAGSSRIEMSDRLAGQPLLLRYAGYRKQGHLVTVLVAEEIESVEEVMEKLDLAFLLLTALAVVFFMLLQQLAMRRTLEPLAAIEAQLGELAQGRRQSIDIDAPRELLPMLDTLNRLLGVLNERMRRSRDALGNLAHALKRPLSLLQQDISGLAEQELRDELQDSTSRIRTIIERELRRARIAGNAMGGEHFAPERDLPELVELMRRLYPAVEVTQRVAGSCSKAVFDREDMLELMGNLLDNACKWAAGEASIELDCDGELVLTVSDDGPGIPSDRLEGLLRRGARLDEQVEGHGLGLSIISGIVDSYDGSIAVAPVQPDGSGTRITVRLPPPR